MSPEMYREIDIESEMRSEMRVSRLSPQLRMSLMSDMNVE